VLLAEKSHPVENLPGPGPGGLESLPQVGILALKLLQPLRGNARRASRRIDCLYTRLRLKRPATESSELVTEVPHELLQLGESFFFRTFVV
jgi:hypothetical protein